MKIELLFAYYYHKDLYKCTYNDDSIRFINNPDLSSSNLIIITDIYDNKIWVNASKILDIKNVNNYKSNTSKIEFQNAIDCYIATSGEEVKKMFQRWRFEQKVKNYL